MVRNNKDKQSSNKSLLLYGNGKELSCIKLTILGDGGGGPLRPMFERIERFGNVSDMPADVKFGHPDNFYQDLEKTSRNLNTWQGELYFELHRGTYTSHGLIKKFNRKCEFLLRDVETLYSFAIAQKLITVDQYPKAELDRIWKLLLLNQFHDVLPGSSIHLVYVDATKYFEDIFASATKMKNHVLEILVGKPSGKDLFVFNPTCWVRKNVQILVDGEAGIIHHHFNSNSIASKCPQMVTGTKVGIASSEMLPAIADMLNSFRNSSIFFC